MDDDIEALVSNFPAQTVKIARFDLRGCPNRFEGSDRYLRLIVPSETSKHTTT
jgi:hypothetical protein